MTKADETTPTFQAVLDEAFRPLTAYRPAYCDYIADRTMKALLADMRATVPGNIIAQVNRVRWDLHPDGGYMVSTKKTIEVEDRNGRRYLITVEEAR
jgi:hypothetical protein